MNHNFNLEEVAKAIEADIGEALPDIRQALAEAKEVAEGRAPAATQPTSTSDLTSPSEP